jgi:hypothetical protein
LGNDHTITASSYLGGSSSVEQVMGSAILSDGKIVLAANVDGAFNGGVTPVLLNGASSNSSGVIIRLSPNGQSILAVTKVSEAVSDLSIDASDRLYVAAGSGGALVLNSSASSVLIKKTYAKKVLRIDATPSGRFAVLISNTDFLSKKVINAEYYNYTSSGSLAGSWGAVSQYSVDVCIDEASQSVVGIGFKNIYADDQSGTNPVDVAVYKGWSYGGSVKYTG